MIEPVSFNQKKYPYGFFAVQLDYSHTPFVNKTLRNDFFQMFWVKSGEVKLHIDSNSITVNKDECAFIGKDEVFRIETLDAELKTVGFNEEFYCRHSFDINFLNNCYFFDNSKGVNKYKLSPQLKSLLLQYYKSLATACTQPFNELLQQFSHNTVERLLLFSQQQLSKAVHIPYTATNTDITIANTFRQLVKQHCKEKRQVKFYTAKLSISDKKLTEICNELYGQSPKKIIIAQAVLEAKRLLRHSSLSIKEIAFEMRFGESSNFIRFFTNTTGKSPKEYRGQIFESSEA